MKLHPGARIALARLRMDETDVAKAIAAGDLASPQRIENATLFAVRITGTGTAYRKQLEEYVYRAPENYLNEHFLDRCRGLPVVWEHPKKGMLDGKEFADRVVGTIVHPYIQGDEVWGIAKIYEPAAAQAMEDEQLSTSPAVVFRGTDGNEKKEMKDGSSLLIEGKPSLLDHLAICSSGVWDKEQGPTGVKLSDDKSTVIGDSQMPDEMEEGAVKPDANDQMDKLLKGIGSLCDRFDSMEERMSKLEGKKDAAEMKGEPTEGKAAADEKLDPDAGEDDTKDKVEGEIEDKPEGAPEEVAADKSRKDGKPPFAGAKKPDADEDEEKEVEKEEAEERADRQRDRRELKSLRELVASMPKVASDKDYSFMMDSQARADSTFQQLGIGRAPPPLQGESRRNYDIRLAESVKHLSPDWKNKDIRTLPQDVLNDIALPRIFADAQMAARSADGVAEGHLREVTTVDDSGRRIKTFFGDPYTWMRDFRSHPRALAKPFFRPPSLNHGSH